MSQLFYGVIATLPDASGVDAYLAWLHGGHMAAVRGGGALTAMAVRLDAGPEGAARVMACYTFASRESFARYERETAPALRAEGVAKFGGRGVRFERMLGEISGVVVV